MLLLSPLISANLPVRMAHNLVDVPNAPLPTGFSFRPYLPGDKQTWIQIHQAADPYRFADADLFLAEFGCNQSSLATRQFFAVAPNGKTVGTATAWSAGKTCGWIKGLSVLFDYAGMGLEEAMLTEACRRFRDFGYTSGLIQLGTARVDLIRVLLHYGFKPVIGTERERAAWKDIHQYFAEDEQPSVFALAGEWLKGLRGRRRQAERA